MPFLLAPIRVFSTQTALPQIRVISNKIHSEQQALEAKLAVLNKQPRVQAFYPQAVPLIENPTSKAERTKQRVSPYKLTRVCNAIGGKHIYDALAMTKDNSKSGDVVRAVLEAARKNGLKKGLSEERMFVKTAITGKKQYGKKIDIKGRGRHGMITSHHSSVRIWLEEKNPADFYKMMLLGKAPPGIGWMMRRILY
jgi:ribosomal protein L22